MAKRVIWSLKAKEERREILEYWLNRTGNKKYSKKLAKAFREKVKYSPLSMGFDFDGTLQGDGCVNLY